MRCASRPNRAGRYICSDLTIEFFALTRCLLGRRLEASDVKRPFAETKKAFGAPTYARTRSRKNRIISFDASGPFGSVWDPRGSPPNQACAAPCTSQYSTVTFPFPSLKILRV